MVQNMKKYVSILGNDGIENDEKTVCCFCQKALTDDYFVDDTGRAFCNRRCRGRRIDLLKAYKEREI